MAEAPEMKMVLKELRRCEKEMDLVCETCLRDLLTMNRMRVKMVFQNLIHSLGRLREFFEANLHNAASDATRTALTEQMAWLDLQMENICCVRAHGFIHHLAMLRPIAEDRVFFLILIGDLWKKHQPLPQGVGDGVAVTNYEMASLEANRCLLGSNPIRMKSALKYAKLVHSLGRPPLGLAICTEAQEAATGDMGPDPHPLSMYYLGRFQHYIQRWNAHAPAPAPAHG